MKIVYLIGNGFDINLGLKTRFRQFYDYYLEQNSPTDTITTFKDVLAQNKDIEQWADLELVLGDYAQNFTKETADDFRELLFDIQDNLAQYISLQKTEIIVSEEDKKKINDDLFFPYRYLSEREKRNFNIYKSQYDQYNYDVNVITFNYTDTFEKIFDYERGVKQLSAHTYGNRSYPNNLNSVEHIHGTTTSNMILGINNVSQLNNEELQKSKKVIRCIVKPEMNKNAGTLRDDRSFGLIAQADLICVFGMSLGSTDAIWWEAISRRLLNSNAVVVIFSINGGTPEIRGFLLEDYKDEIREKLLSYSNYSEKERNSIFERIFVCLNSKMFNVSNLLKTKTVA